MILLLPSLALSLAMPQNAAPAQPIAFVQGENHSQTAVPNNGSVTATDHTTPVHLARGGDVRVCRSTTVHFAHDASPAGQSVVRPSEAGLLLSLDRGALEAKYMPGSFSDVIMTPDLRILISAPGAADLRLNVGPQGDTCVENTGQNAPYVTVSSLMEGGVYRVQPGQRVLFVDGSLNRVVDHEPEPCGCPDDTPPPANNVAESPAAKANPFPTAVSQGLEPPPAPPTKPVVPPGQAHAQVSATLSSSQPLGPPPSGEPQSTTPPQAAVTTQQPTQQQAAPHRGFFGKVGHFFAHVFGAD